MIPDCSDFDFSILTLSFGSEADQGLPPSMTGHGSMERNISRLFSTIMITCKVQFQPQPSVDCSYSRAPCGASMVRLAPI